MSVYSGFATRQQEAFYNKLIEKSIQLLAYKCIKYEKGENVDHNHWDKTMKKLCRYMTHMEKTKYLPPRFSDSVSRVIEKKITLLHTNFTVKDLEMSSISQA